MLGSSHLLFHFKKCAKISNMKKILMVTKTSVDTISSCAYNLYQALKKEEEYDVYVYSIDQSCNFSYPFENIFPSPSNTTGLMGKIRIIKELYRIKKEVAIDYSISTLTAFTAYNLLAFYKDKKIAIYHAPAKQALLSGWMTYFFCVCTIFFSNLFCKQLWAVSEEALDDINKFSLFKRKNIKLYNIHYFDKIAARAMDDGNIYKNEKYILYVGSIYELKGFDRLVRSFSKVAQSSKELNLLVCGSFRSKEYEKKIFELIDFYGLNDRIKFLGYQSNPYKYMKHSIALVSSSYTESLPGVIIEALSIGVPVISTNSSKGIWEIFSVLDKYQNKITTNFVCSDGYITPNTTLFTDLERKVLNNDETCLADAIISAEQNQIKPVFLFREKCMESSVLKKISLSIN